MVRLIINGEKFDIFNHCMFPKMNKERTENSKETIAMLNGLGIHNHIDKELTIGIQPFDLR